MDSTISPATNTIWQQYSMGYQNMPTHLVPVVSSVASILQNYILFGLHFVEVLSKELSQI
jgi:hypothetical protein